MISVILYFIYNVYDEWIAEYVFSAPSKDLNSILQKNCLVGNLVMFLNVNCQACWKSWAPLCILNRNRNCSTNVKLHPKLS